MDPDNHIFFSNRCAAYMKADSVSKALRDAVIATDCIVLQVIVGNDGRKSA